MRRSAGLTLIEVLAAVAVLGIGYITVIQAGSEGLLREGETRRHLAASLIADQALFDIEFDLDAGLIPEPDTREVEGFEVEIEVTPVTLAVPPREPSAPIDVPAVDGDSLLGGSRSAESPLRRVELRVRWQEGFSERAVSRTTFAFDHSSVLAVLDALAAASELGSADGTNGAGAGTAAEERPGTPGPATPTEAEGEDR